jgi:molecular chaperone DnaK (HSP70)
LPTENSTQYVIGIDLGTTNCGVAFARPASIVDPHQLPPVELFDVAQLTNPSEVRKETLLPSFLYIPGAADFPVGSTALPWEPEPKYVVGQLAKKRGVESANRLVHSAKSWLSHSGVDRTAPLLPLHLTDASEKLSPVEASRR